MNKKTIIIQAALIIVILCGGFSSSHAETMEGYGFGSSVMKNVSPVAKKSGECMSFEASFSEPLDQKPSAMLDIEQHFVNLYNKFLEVTKIGEKKYRMTLLASTTESCPQIQDGTRITISTLNGTEKQDSYQTLPSSITFEAQRSNKQIILKRDTSL